MATETLHRRSKAPAIPSTMRAAAIDRFGPPEVLTLHALPVPKPDEHELLIQVRAAGVGIWDAKIRGGTWADGNERFPLVLGVDGSGVVVARGPHEKRFEVGDHVWACEYKNPNGGFYAEYVAIDPDHVGLVPDHLDLFEAGAAAVTGLTALQGIDDHLEVEKRQTVLIFGGTGAVGTLAIQFAKHRHARVVATATGQEARIAVEKLGADVVFDARNSAELDTLEQIVPERFDRVLALAGGEALERCLDLVHSHGRVAYPNGVEPEPRPVRSFRLIKYDAESSPEQFDRLARVATEAELRVPIAARFPLDRAAEAHARIERGHVVGRIVIDVARE